MGDGGEEMGKEWLLRTPLAFFVDSGLPSPTIPSHRLTARPENVQCKFLELRHWRGARWGHEMGENGKGGGEEGEERRGRGEGR